MQDTENRVCLAVLPYINNSYKSIHNKAVFIDHIERQRGLIYGDEAFIILEGGIHMTATVDAIKKMEWILESA